MKTGDIRAIQRQAETQLSLPWSLRTYQWEGVAFLCRNRSVLLADEMGLGKTVQTAVALALTLNGQKDMKRALVVSPASLAANWKAELETWVPSLVVRRLVGDRRTRKALYLLPVPVLLGSYEQVRQDALDCIPRACFDIVVLDEAQRIKNRHSRTALACRLLSPRRAWALSATPLENNTDDVRGILRFLDPGGKWEAGDEAVANQLGKLMLRRRKRDVRGELPPVIVQDLRLNLTEAQRQQYDELWNSRGQEWTDVSHRVNAHGHLLGMITRLKVVCNYVQHEDSSAKLDALNQVCEGAGSRGRILVFSQFVKTLKWLSRKTALPFDFITGEMTEGHRLRAMRRFQTGAAPRMLLVSLRAGGVGLNLGEATHVVLFDRWWNPAVEKQAIFRAHRFDRGEPLHVVRFVTTGTVEERIDRILAAKEELFGDVVDSRSIKRTGLSMNDLLHILNLPPPTAGAL